MRKIGVVPCASTLPRERRDEPPKLSERGRESLIRAGEARRETYERAVNYRIGFSERDRKY